MFRTAKTARIFCVAVLAAGLLIATPSSVGAAAGDLDPTFGVGGLVTTDFDGRGDFALAVAIQPDGRIVTAGNSAPAGVFAVDFALARYSLGGTLDAGFGGDGTVLTDFGAPLDAASDIAVQPDGKIVAAGISAGDFALARYNPDGTLDLGFGAGGLVTTDFGGFDQATAVALQQDAKIVAAGSSNLFGFDDFALARYNPDGTLDLGFGAGGKVTTDFGSVSASASDVAVAGDGPILVAGIASFGFGFDFALARFNPDGSLDLGFGSGGTTTTDFGAVERAFGMVLHPDGRITLAGAKLDPATPESGDFALARYNADGSLDAGFGSGGKVTTDLFPGSDMAFAVVLDPSGRVTAVGITNPAPGSGDFGLARYNADGSLDAGFGSGGIVTTDLGGSNVAFDAVLQQDGKVVAAGTNVGTGFADFALARYLDSGATLVEVDVKPKDAANIVLLRSIGVVPVAILTTDAFDASTVDPASVCFGDDDVPSERDCTEKHRRGHLQDANGDGRADLLLHYETAETGIDPGDTEACLGGKTFAGLDVAGCDVIATR